MIKIKVLLFIFIILLFNNDVISKMNFDFRNTYWGMSAKDVIKSEKNKKYKANGNLISFKDNISGHPADVIYFFDGNGLAASQIIFYNISSQNELKSVINFIKKNYVINCNMIVEKQNNDSKSLVVTKLAGSDDKEKYSCKKYNIEFFKFTPPLSKNSFQVWVYFNRK